MSSSLPTSTSMRAHLAASTPSIIASNDRGAHWGSSTEHLAVHEPQRLAGCRRGALSGQSQRIDVARRREQPLLKDLAKADRRVRLGFGVFTPHPGKNGLRAGEHVLGEAPRRLL